MSGASALGDHVDTVTLIDHHVHGCWLQSGDRQRFENGLNEANVEPLADFDSAFDSQLGFAVRAHCAPLLGMSRHADPDAYWDRRSEHSECRPGPPVPARGQCVRLAGGYRIRRRGSRSRPPWKSFRVGERTRSSAWNRWPRRRRRAGGDYASAFEEILHARAATAVATKSILAYRGGFAGDLSEPARSEVAGAAGRWRDGGGVRLTDRVLLRFGLYQALRLGKPLQFHVGFGDRDCDLHTTNPLYLLDFLRSSGDTPVMLLHCYPYEREAGYLAQAFNNVYLDGGLTINYLGARSADFIGRLLETGAVSQDPVCVGRFRPRRAALPRGEIVAERNA